MWLVHRKDWEGKEKNNFKKGKDSSIFWVTDNVIGEKMMELYILMMELYILIVLYK